MISVANNNKERKRDRSIDSIETPTNLSILNRPTQIRFNTHNWPQRKAILLSDTCAVRACVLPFSFANSVSLSDPLRFGFVLEVNMANHEGSNARPKLHERILSSMSRRTVAAHPWHDVEIDVSEDVRIYTDDENKFKIEVPQEWQVGTGESNGFKSLTAFYPQEESNSNVSVVITGLGPDYTKMESFGKVEEFADTLVSGLDRSWKKPPGVAAKLVSCKSSKGFYYIEYTLQNPGESRKHLYSAIGMSLNGWYNRLYTVTGQFVDEETDKYASKIQKAVASFRFL